MTKIPGALDQVREDRPANALPVPLVVDVDGVLDRPVVGSARGWKRDSDPQPTICPSTSATVTRGVLATWCSYHCWRSSAVEGSTWYVQVEWKQVVVDGVDGRQGRPVSRIVMTMLALLPASSGTIYGKCEVLCGR